MPRYYAPKVNKFVTFAACIPVALSGGVGYCFGLWSPLLKANYSLDQQALESIAAAHNFGAYSSFISGFLYDAMDRRQHVGPGASLLIGSLVSGTGFMLLYAAVTKRIVVDAVWKLMLLAMFAGNGGTWFDTATLTTNIRNFPASRGIIVGVMKSCIGLSTSLYTLFFQGFFGEDPGKFLLFLAWLPSLISLCMVPLVNYVPYVQQSEKNTRATQERLYVAMKIIGALAIYLMGTSLLISTSDGGGLVTEHLKMWLGIGSILMLAPIIAIVYDSGGLFAERHQYFYIGNEEDDSDADSLNDDTSRQLLESNLGRDTRNIDRATIYTQGGNQELHSSAIDTYSVDGTTDLEHDMSLSLLDGHHERRSLPRIDDECEMLSHSYSVIECLGLTDFWILAIICCVGIGSGLAFLNNAAQVVVSLGGSGAMKSIMVTFFGVANAAGRMVFGAVPEHLMHVHGVPRPVFLVLSAIGGCFTYVAIGLTTKIWVLYPLSLLSGFWFGGHWCLLPSLASELFGLENFASIYTVLQLAPAAGGYFLGVYLVGSTYDSVGKKHGDPENTCFGPDCFESSFLIVAGLCAFSSLLSFWLLKKTFKFYHARGDSMQVFQRDLSGI